MHSELKWYQIDISISIEWIFLVEYIFYFYECDSILFYMKYIVLIFDAPQIYAFHHKNKRIEYYFDEYQ